MRLAPGKSPADLLAWLRTQDGPPPAMPMGGTSFLSTGEVNQITADFAPGEYEPTVAGLAAVDPEHPRRILANFRTLFG